MVSLCEAFGMRVPPLIESGSDIAKKMDLLQALGDIQIAMKMLERNKTEVFESPIDVNYRSLKCAIEPIERSSDEFLWINEFVKHLLGAVLLLSGQHTCCPLRNWLVALMCAAADMLRWHGLAGICTIRMVIRTPIIRLISLTFSRLNGKWYWCVSH